MRVPVPATTRFARNLAAGEFFMSEQDQADLRLEYARLKQDHADFDAAINAMLATGCDPLQIQRMKKKKLMLKDRLLQLQDKVVPDIIA